MRKLLKQFPFLRPWLYQLKTILPDERDFLFELFGTGSVGAEVGVYKGDFSNRLLRYVRPRKLHLIDAWKFEPDGTYAQAGYGGDLGQSQLFMDQLYREVTERFRSQIASGQVQIHRGYSETTSQQIADQSLDWVYIDANHLYEFVKKDLESYFPKMRSGGWITGDDYGKTGWWQGGVERAVDEFVAHHAVELVEIRNHQFVLRKQ